MAVADEINKPIKDRHHAGQEVDSNPNQRWLWFWAIILASSLPMMIPYLIGMWSFEHYRYLPFVFLVVGYLVWTRSDRVLRGPSGWAAWSLVIVGILTLLAAILVPSLWLAGLAFVMFCFAMIGSMRGIEDRTMIGAAVPLLMLIQLPVNLDTWLVNRLQGITTDLSSVVLDVIGVPHSISGNTMQLASKELFVAEACSGVQSVFTLAFIACVIVAINRRRLWLVPLYLLISVLLAIAGNTLRVTTVAVAEDWFAWDLSSGWQHDVLGYITLGIATLFLLSFDQLIMVLLHPASAGSDSSSDNPLIRAWNFLVADWQYSNDDGVYGRVAEQSQSDAGEEGLLDRVVMNRTGWIASIAVFAVIGLVAAVQATRVEINQAPQTLVGSYVVFNPEPDVLQGQYQVTVVSDHTINRGGQDPRLGQNADLWKVQIDDKLDGEVVVSQTYRGWHELCVCYRNMDWEEIDREVITPAQSETPGQNDTSFISAKFKNRVGNYGYLLFTGINEDGSIHEAPSSFGAIQSRLKSRLERSGVVTAQNLVMFQMWLVTNQKLSPDLLSKMQTDFLDMRSRLATSVVEDAVDKTTTASLQANGEG